MTERLAHTKTHINSSIRLTPHTTCVTLGSLLKLSEPQSKDKIKLITVHQRDVMKCAILKCICNSAWHMARVI